MSISDTQKLTTLHPEVNGQPDNNTNIYPNVPRYLTLCYNLVVNGNGVQFSHGGSSSYKFVSVPKEMSPYPQYDISLFAFGGGTTIQTTTPVTDLSIIKEYLMFMNGSDYVPVYNATNPNECFLWKTQDDSCWKLQYAENIPNIGSVLLAFKVDEDKLPLMKTIKEISGIETQQINNDFNRVEEDTYFKFHVDDSMTSMPLFKAKSGSNCFGFIESLQISWTNPSDDHHISLHGGCVANAFVSYNNVVSGRFNLKLFDDMNSAVSKSVDAHINAIANPNGNGYAFSNIDIYISKENLSYFGFDKDTCEIYLAVTKLFDYNIGG